MGNDRNEFSKSNIKVGQKFAFAKENGYSSTIFKIIKVDGDNLTTLSSDGVVNHMSFDALEHFISSGRAELLYEEGTTMKKKMTRNDAIKKICELVQTQNGEKIRTAEEIAREYDVFMDFDEHHIYVEDEVFYVDY